MIASKGVVDKGGRQALLLRRVISSVLREGFDSLFNVNGWITLLAGIIFVDEGVLDC